MNVLSIDFDYFQKADIVTVLSYFPSPYDYSIERALFEWTLLYTKDSSRKVLEQVELMQNEFDKVCKLVQSIGISNPHTPALVVNSHMYLYNFIMETLEEDDELNIINIDMHHDVFHPETKDANCSNWGNVLKSEHPNTNLVWIKNPYASGAFPTKLVDEETSDLELMHNYKYDHVFLCRSDNFLVPHLDTAFEKLWRIMDEYFYDLSTEENINIPRNIENHVDKYHSLALSALRGLYT